MGQPRPLKHLVTLSPPLARAYYCLMKLKDLVSFYFHCFSGQRALEEGFKGKELSHQSFLK